MSCCQLLQLPGVLQNNKCLETIAVYAGTSGHDREKFN